MKALDYEKFEAVCLEFLEQLSYLASAGKLEAWERSSGARNP